MERVDDYYRGGDRGDRLHFNWWNRSRHLDGRRSKRRFKPLEFWLQFL